MAENETKSLVIVESPTKARTLGRFLGKRYVVESSVGHVRDLPANASEVPPELKGKPWARLGVNVEKDFEPLYVVQPEKKKTIAALRKRLKEVGEVLLATDEDREGEAISWHLVEVLKPKVPVRRMVFHEITKPAILRSLESTRDIDEALVGAQETRRIIDRLYGYEVSPILWKKVAPKLSAGRVQSVAILMLVERERARMRFREAEYWDLVAVFRTASGETFRARLATLDGERVAGGNDFDPDSGELKRKKARQVLAAEAAALARALAGGSFTVLSAEEKPFTRRPAPPFTTSTLQQEANRKLRFDARRTMRAAQRLYENGFITYMRTDSVALSSEAIALSRRAVAAEYGPDYLPESPRFYKTKVKNAQEAHEAIRPAGERIVPTPVVRKALGEDEAKVYDLIRKRTMACQMKDAHGRRMTVRVGGDAAGTEAVFQAVGNVIDFPGFIRAYLEGTDDPEPANGEAALPPVREGERLTADEVAPEQHFTAPPPRLTEAGLVKALEESGIGRPSTYASIIETILRREYSFRKGNTLVPTFTAFAVVGLMEGHFADLIDPAFTAKMEDRLDAISRGEMETLPYLREFYFGNDVPGLKQVLEQKIEDIDAREVCTTAIGQDAEGRTIAVRVGRFGPYLERGEERAPLPDGICPDELTPARAAEILTSREKEARPIGHHPGTGEPVYVKSGRYGPYVQLGDPDPDGKQKPKMVSLLKGMSPEDLSFDTALELLALPRVLGADEDGVEVTANLGRYGPYVRRGWDNASLRKGDDLLAVTLERALELLAMKGKGRGRSAGAEPLKVFPAVAALDGAEVRLLDGRYGPYVTDGKVNATLPKDVGDPKALTEEQAVELILKKRAAPRRRRPARKK